MQFKWISKRLRQVDWRQFFQNRYVYISLLFLVWVFFFDGSRLTSQEKLEQDISKMKMEKVKYERLTQEVAAEKQDILGNRERYAREFYYMKRADEDVYIIEE